MTSKQVLIIHTVVFATFLMGSLASPFLALYFPGIFSSPFYLPATALIMIATIASWKKYGGCPFTVWENQLRQKENPLSVYTGSCIPYYASKWFGWKLPSAFYTAVLVGLLILPITIGVFYLI